MRKNEECSDNEQKCGRGKKAISKMSNGKRKSEEIYDNFSSLFDNFPRSIAASVFTALLFCLFATEHNIMVSRVHTKHVIWIWAWLCLSWCNSNPIRADHLGYVGSHYNRSQPVEEQQAPNLCILMFFTNNYYHYPPFKSSYSKVVDEEDMRPQKRSAAKNYFLYLDLK